MPKRGRSACLRKAGKADGGNVTDSEMLDALRPPREFVCPLISSPRRRLSATKFSFRPRIRLHRQWLRDGLAVDGQADGEGAGEHRLLTSESATTAATTTTASRAGRGRFAQVPNPAVHPG